MIYLSLSDNYNLQFSCMEEKDENGKEEYSWCPVKLKKGENLYNKIPVAASSLNHIWKNNWKHKELYKDGKSIALVGPHYANWEWIMSLDSFVKYQGVAAYTKINNPHFNNAMLNSRSKFGTKMIETSKIIAEMKENNRKNIPTIYGLLSDQSPHINKAFYWSKFLGIKVPIHTGAEMLAKRFNMNVVYISTKKIKRGHYETTFSLITDNASSLPDYQITDIFLEKVEAQIRKEPAYYFWTHRRFKHKDKAPE